jgi:RNA polymerase sigma-70 factor, ECF subfamily
VDTAENPEDYTHSQQVGSEIEAAIQQLRPEYRAVIVLWHMEGRPYDEIADIMGLPLGTVKTYIHRGSQGVTGMLQHLRN